MIQPLVNLKKEKKSNTAVFLGSGSSINDITPEQWIRINQYDTWAVNNWCYHPFVPNFYHLEVKKYNKDLVRKRIEEKGNLYKKVNFIINKERSYLIGVVGLNRKIYNYYMDKINMKKTTEVPRNYIPNPSFNRLTCNLNSSFTMILELLWKMQYEKIIIFGMDMKDSKYFWTGRPEYGETHCQWNKDHRGSKATDPHAGAHIKNFIIWFNNTVLKRHNSKIYVGYKETLLYPEIEYMEI